ncbi:hypothetical protein [Streptomyces taklimakanensis]|nr:hypothetical protein [Streptomyces taklimakanensis]
MVPAPAARLRRRNIKAVVPESDQTANRKKKAAGQLADGLRALTAHW